MRVVKEGLGPLGNEVRGWAGEVERSGERRRGLKMARHRIIWIMLSDELATTVLEWLARDVVEGPRLMTSRVRCPGA